MANYAAAAERFKNLAKKENYKIPEQEKKSYDITPNLWKSTKKTSELVFNKKTGLDTSTALFYFLPFVDEAGNQTNFREINSHFVKKNGRILSEYCLKDIGEECPICNHGSSIYKSHPNSFGKSVEDNPYKKEFKLFMPKKSYLTNIYMIDDKLHPENNGKIFTYLFSVTILKLIESAMIEDDDVADDTASEYLNDVKKTAPFAPFNPLETRPFLLYTTYTLGKFAPEYNNEKYPSRFLDNEKYPNAAPIFVDGNGEADLPRIYELLDKCTDIMSVNKYSTLEKVTAKLLDLLNKPSSESSGAAMDYTKELEDFAALKNEFTQTTPVKSSGVASSSELDELERLVSL